MDNRRSLWLPNLDIGGIRLSVLTRLQTTRKLPSGLMVPRVFRAPKNSLYVDIPRHWMGDPDGHRRGNLTYYTNHFYRPRRLHPSIRGIEEYIDEYERLARERSQGEAGKRAKDLLFSHLDDHQREQAEKEMYFDVWLFNDGERWRRFKEAELETLNKKSFIRIVHGAFFEPRVMHYRIDRTHACGNITSWPGKHETNLCIHPPEPHALDDICLAQKLALEHEPDDFMRTAHGTYRSRPERYGRMWEQPPHRSRADILFPVGVRPPVPENVILSEN